MHMRGFTLVEILISAAILSIVIMSVFGILRVGELSYSSDLGLLDLQQEARIALDGMSREIRQAQAGTVAISAGNTRVDFRIPNVVNQISYYLLNNQVIREHPAGIRKVLSNDVGNLIFSLANRIVRVQLGLAKVVRRVPLAFTLTEEVRLRN